MYSLFLTALLAVSVGAVPECQGTLVFNPPQNLSSVTWYPSNFSTDSPPVFPDNFTCEYQINVPQGLFVFIELTLNITNFQNESAPIQVIDQLGKIEDVFSARSEWFFFIAPGGKMKLSTGKSKVKFGFTLQWQSLPGINQKIIQINKTDTRPFVWSSYGSEARIITTYNRVSATIIPPPFKSYRALYRGIIFFDGLSWNMTSLGTGLQLIDEKTQYVSSRQMMTVMYLNHNSYSAQTIFQDYTNTKNIVQFQGLRLNGADDFAVIKLNAIHGPSALQTYYMDAVITSINGTGSLYAYLGGVTVNKTNLIASYDAENCENYLPQAFFGLSKTFVLENGVAMLNISQDGYYDFVPTKNFGRKGFVATNNYNFESTYQYVNVQIDTPSNASSGVFKYSIQLADLVPGAKLQIFSVSNSHSSSSALYYDSSNRPDLNVTNEIVGNQFYVTYTSYHDINKGFYMDFEIVEHPSASSQISLFVVLTFISFLMMY
ncbi:hypothetical protein CAEBREN_26113 [Caenorhabditis brenneri]|uniref:Uncharacterized protein n=1 Tax=Caenorhabditis brenneri TaxID=135651 RepID=G0M9G6_CAEBE|nr:hypothetical protein CAEBREN_26113 [Caenorhabditis brenneri]